MRIRWLELVALSAFPLRCDQPLLDAARHTRPLPALAASSPPAYVHMESLDALSPPVWVMRGGPHGRDKIVFLHGMCAHGLGYAQAFQFSAAKRGILIAPQGDVSCGGGTPWSKWSA